MFEQLIVYFFYTIMFLILLSVLSSVIFNKVKKYTIKVFKHKMEKIDTLMTILEKSVELTLNKYQYNPELLHSIYRDKKSIIKDLNMLKDDVSRLYNILSKDLKDFEKVDNKISLFRKQEHLIKSFSSVSSEIYSALNYIKLTFFTSPTSDDVKEFRILFNLLSSKQ